MMVAVVGTKMPWAKLRRVVHPTVFLLTLVLVAVALNLYVLRPSKRTPEPWTDVARNKPAEAIARALHVAERPWANSPPGWCKDLIANPLESGMYRNSSLCTRGRFDVICKKDGLPRFFSQYNQDIWSFQNVRLLHLIHAPCLSCGLV